MKRLTILLAILVFGLTAHALAASKVLSDSAMDQVNAGDWVVLNNGTTNVAVADVYSTNNTLDLLDQSQSQIQALSNANAVDSAIAVQSNVARVSGTTPTSNNVNGSNYATLNQFRPSDANSSNVSIGSTTTNISNNTLGQASQSSSSLAMGHASSSAYGTGGGAWDTYNDNEHGGADAAFAQAGVSVGKTIGTDATSFTAEATDPALASRPDTSQTVRQ